MTYHGRDLRSVRRRRRNTRTTMLIVSLILLLLAAVNGSIALLMDSTSKVENAFTPANVNVEVKEIFENNKKENVYVHNSSNIKAYVRVTLVERWERRDKDGTKTVPRPSDGETVIDWGDWATDTTDPDWFEVDGIYYYTRPLDAENDDTAKDDTAKLIDSVTVTLPKGYTYYLDVLAEAIQAEPADAVEEAWADVDVADEGLLVKAASAAVQDSAETN